MVSVWRVAEDIVTLSDHRHIIFHVTLRATDSPSRLGSNHRRDVGPLSGSIETCSLQLLKSRRGQKIFVPRGFHPNQKEEAAWFRDKLTSICDASMLRVRCAQRPGAAYWWSEDIAQMRLCCLRARHTMDARLLERVIATLFAVVSDSPSSHLTPSDWSDELGITESELDRAVRRMGARNTAPGPDGIPGRAWVLAIRKLWGIA
ncbi:hypothetical protein PYW07_007248 [Mythimna separata]|uniref:Uncharacterized protein n=1 Tax=Mythimna separata TaxID=271217 RepID=A0AAD8E0Z3_MYTSE|nr:hypothetical protein PYW07_007248 [Mythimna separata]